MVKHTETIRRQQPKNYLSVLDHFVGFVHKRLRNSFSESAKTALVRPILKKEVLAQSNHIFFK